ncbi:PREDICTED: meiotic recombination protein REC114 isoform X2 [Chinchilla lanigera]|uniref:meiotic recombination protein REC114 isoform X2 n=1 Tax=Chinchilla lanigera TaxID=34839 RepID=UPI00038EDF60|nr:PREDICTED: meiotic recombination protein REC114 isoform X2 [Chinchilla lanigera]
MAEAGKAVTSLGVPRRDAAEWPLQRYGRFMLSGTGELSGSGPEAGAAPSPTWKVFDSNEESGYLVLTIVISGHFFISQGQTLLEGFSLIGSKNWLKIVRRVDCLLFGSTIKNKSRMFRVQFAGESKEQALEHCCSCVQSLAQYITVEVPDSMAQLSPGLLWAGDRQGRDGEQSVALQPGSILASEELPFAYAQSAWSVEELGPFLRLCLMDQNFPAFVEKVEGELKKLTGMRN